MTFKIFTIIGISIAVAVVGVVCVSGIFAILETNSPTAITIWGIACLVGMLSVVTLLGGVGIYECLDD